MNKEKIEILIVVVALLVLSFAVCGCKDEAEATVTVQDITPPLISYSCPIHGEVDGCLNFYDGEVERIYCMKCYGEYLDKHIQQVVMVDKTIEYIPKSDPNEPNDPIQELAKLFEQVLDQEGRLIEVVGLCIERIEKLEEHPVFHIPVMENPTDLVWTYPIGIATEPEPNEPEVGEDE